MYQSLAENQAEMLLCNLITRSVKRLEIIKPTGCLTMVNSIIFNLNHSHPSVDKLFSAVLKWLEIITLTGNR